MSEGIEKAHKELAKHIADLEQEKEDNQHSGPPRYTVKQCAAELKNYKKSSKSNRTSEDYEYRLKYLEDWYGELEVGQIIFSHGTAFLQQLTELGLGPATINHHIQAAKTLFNFAVNNGWVDKNPWKRLEKLNEQGRQRGADFEIVGNLTSEESV